ncbi:MAG: hypothetical protein ACJ762_07030 [Solirubrobacteraceae bacterium]
MTEGSGSTVNYLPVTTAGEDTQTAVTVSGHSVEIGSGGLFDRDQLLLALAVTHDDVARLRGET